MSRRTTVICLAFSYPLTVLLAQSQFCIHLLHSLCIVLYTHTEDLGRKMSILALSMNYNYVLSDRKERRYAKKGL